jgi:tetratricopeptide (TPR) repeat protein
MNTAGLPPEHHDTQDTPPPFWLRWRWLHWILRRWWGLFALLGGALLVNCVLLLLSRGLDHWWDGVQDQISALSNWISSYPLQAGLVIALVFFLTGGAGITHLVLTYQEHKYEEERKRALLQPMATQQPNNPAPPTLASPTLETIPPGATVVLNPQGKHQAIGTHAEQHITYNRNIYHQSESKEQSSQARNPFYTEPPQVSTPIWNVPYQRNSYFIGREQALEKLHTELANNKIAILTQSIPDLVGGVGKTQTAVEYAYRFHKEYQAVLWSQAETLQLYVDSLVGIAHLLALPEQETPNLGQVIAAVKHWLEIHPEWLLILDNVEDWTSLQELLPAPGHGHLLLITRMPISEAKIKPITIGPLSSTAGAEFLLRRAGPPTSAAARSETSGSRESQAQRLSEALGGFPLALEQAGAYIKKTRCSAVSYLRSYRGDRTNKAELERRRTRLFTGYTKVGALTWMLAFERIRENTAAVDLLRYCSFLHPDTIPEELFFDGIVALSAPLRRAVSDHIGWNEAVRCLSEFSLLEHDPEAKILRIHRLTQIFIKEDMSQPNRRNWAERTIKLVNQAFPRVEAATWEHCQRHLSQALTCASLITQWKFTFAEAADLLDKAGLYCYARTQYNLALPLLTQSLDIQEQQLGKDHPHLVPTLSTLALIYQAQEQPEKELPLLQQILAIQEEFLGLNHLDLVPILIREAKIYQTQERSDEALPLLQRALTVQRNQLGPEHAELASTLIDIAKIYQSQGNLDDEVLSLSKQALAIRERQLGKMHSSLVFILSSMATLYHTRGQDEEARPLLEQARAIYEQDFGKEHPGLLPILSNLDAIYHARDQFDQELPLLKQILRIQIQQLGEENPELVPYLFNLGGCHYSLRQYEEALPLLQRALGIREQQLGKTHPDLVPILNKLVDIFRARGPHEEALSFLQRVLEIQTQQLGADHLELAPLLKDLAELYQEQEQQEEAADCLQKALTIREQHLGKDHLDVASSLRDLGVLYRLQGRYEEAWHHLKRALAIRQQQLGLEHGSVALILDDLATLHRSWAGTLHAHAQEIRAKQQPSN